MSPIFDAIERLSRYAVSWVEFTSIVLFFLTTLLIVLTYTLTRERWVEACAWASLLTATLAIQFMLAGWREVAEPERHEMPGIVVRSADGGGVHFKECPNCPEMVVIQPGFFFMGANAAAAAPEEGPPRKMMIAKRYAIGRQAVTRAEYAAFVLDSGRSLVACVDGPKSGPAQCVSWDDAQAYVLWLKKQTGMTYRLASAAEWEYAGRGGSPAPAAHSRGEIIRASISVAPVPATNGFGVAGMGAGLGELVEDCWSPTIAELPSDGRPLRKGFGCAARVVKGLGSGHNGGARELVGRRPINASVNMPDVGFRVAREMPRAQK